MVHMLGTFGQKHLQVSPDQDYQAPVAPAACVAHVVADEGVFSPR